MEALPFLLVFALGLLIGGIFGANRAFRLVMQGRALRRANARIARFLPDVPPSRTVADLLAGRVRVRFGGATYDLPTLPRAASREWMGQLDASFAALASAIDAAEDTSDLLALLATQTDILVDVLVAYDHSGVLPSRDEIDVLATDAEIMYAVLEVWRAANPLAVTATSGQAEGPNGITPELPSSSPVPTAGAPTTSSEPSLTNSSSSTSTPRRNVSTTKARPGSTRRSRPTASPSSSPATSAPTSAGVRARAARRPAGAEG